MSRASHFKRLLALDLAPIRKRLPNGVAPVAEQCVGSQRTVRLSRGARRRRLIVERLEQRAMLAASELVLNSLLPAQSGEIETSTIVWQGEQRSVNAGHWIVAVDGLPTSPSLQLATAAQELKHLGAGPAVKALRSLGGRGSLLIETASGVNYADLRTSLSGLPGFRYLEPDFTINIDSTTSNDPRFPDLFGMNNVGQTGGVLDADIDAPEAWDLTIGSHNNVVGVIDTGIDYNHPDLVGNVWTNPGEIAGDGIDNDTNGYVDDLHGYDFVNGDGDPLDDNGHGTHVSGTIGANGNNTLGVVGVNWQVQIMALKFLNASGSGAISAAISALNYATMMHNSYGVNIRLTSNSWGGGAFSQAMSDAIAASGNAGMLFVAAAGNSASDNDTTVSYPAGYDLPNVISVAATDQNDVLASFSSYGATTVDLAAPGVNILSTTRNNTYGSMSGTSMATPHVSGVAALAWSMAPGATHLQVRDALYSGVDSVPGLIGKTATGGRLNARNTLNALAIVVGGDVGDTLATARVTAMAAPFPGDHIILPSSSIGDGTFDNKDVDVDLYQISGTAGSTFTAITSQPAGGDAMDTVLRLFNSAGVEVAVNDNFSGQYSQINYTFLTSGVYYVGVSGASNATYNPNFGGSGVSGSTGVYRLDLSLDVGDTLGTAAATGLVLTGNFTRSSTPIGDGIFGSGDVDLYQISGITGSTFTAITSQPTVGAAMDTVLRLFNSAGVEVAVNNNFAGLYSQINYTFPSTGVYYVGVSGAGNASYDPTVGGSGLPGSTGDYSLKLTLYSPAEFELSSLIGGNGSQGFTATGTGNYSELTGPSQYRSVGDVNGDLIDDFILGAPGDIGTTSMTTGHVYLIFGTTGVFPAELDLDSLDGTSGYVMDGISLGDRTGFSGGGAGDVNHDGIPDLVIGAIWGNPDSGRLKAGQSFVVYGGISHLAALDVADGYPADGHIGLVNLNGTHGFTINGIAADDNAGRPSGAGDLNGDGIHDLVIGALGAGTSGEVYVVFGRDSTLGQSFPPAFELSTVNGVNGFVIPALGASDTLGIAVGGAGDINKDGISDLIVGAYTADPAGRANAGQAYVIFGRKTADAGNFPATFNLASLNGTNGFTVNGNAAGDLLGNGVGSAGDVNGDGIDDVLIGASSVDDNGKLNAGAAYVIFGKVTATSGAFPAVLEVATLNGSNGSAFRGVAAGDGASSVGWAGDVNADGYDDILIGASSADPNNISSAGQSYLIYGGPSFAASFDLASLLAANGGDGSNGVALNGFQSGAAASRANGIGDINDDGIDDLRIGSPYVDLNGLVAPGQAYIVFGKPTEPGVRVMPPSGLTTTEAGGTVSFSVTLKTQPTADVTIPISSSDLTEGAVSITSGITFTPGNWNVPQTVTVTGVNDAYADGDIAYRILLGAVVSTDLAYSGLDPVNVSVTNVDNDVITTTFTKTQNSSIPDPGTLTSSLTVTNVGTILDLNVQVNINHTWDEDLDVYLIAPDGTRVELFTDVGGTSDNFTNTVLDDEASMLITSGAAPFTGTFKPEGNLTLLEGKSLSGTWKLEVTDDTRIDKGTLLNWSIIARYTTAPSGPKAVVTPTSGLVTTESGGSASFTVRLDTQPTADVTIPVGTSDTTEGTVSMRTVSISNLIFTQDNWNDLQTVTITGVNDLIVDGNIAYTIVLGVATSGDADFNGLNPTDVSVTNIDNEVPPTKFYVVNDGSSDRTYEYGSTGASVENYALNSGNTAPRGAASTLVGDYVWVVDANKKVYVYDTSGMLQGTGWTAGGLPGNATVEGIATNGTDIWIVDARSDKVYRYSGEASRTSGSVNATSSFSLNSSNTSPKDIVTDGTSLWVVNDSSTDKVFKYSVANPTVGVVSWTITTYGVSSPTGITIDPSGVSQNIWIVDSGKDRVYEYTSARSWDGNHSTAVSFALAAGNTNPQGIADPPVSGMETSSLVSIDDVVSKVSGYASPPVYSDSVVTALSQPRVETSRVQPIQTKAEILFASVTKRSPESVGLSDWAKPKLTDVTPAEQNDHRTHDLALLELVNESIGDSRGHFTDRR